MIPPPPRTASTSNDGRYEFRDIPPGRYTLRVQRSGYLALNYGQRRPGEQGRPLEIADKEVAEKVDFALPRMGVISGRVLDELGEPIAGVTVWALQTRYVAGPAETRPDRRQRAHRHHGPVPAAVTPAWRLRRDGNDSRDLAARQRSEAGLRLCSHLFSRDVHVRPQAQRVKIGVGQETPGIDFSLVPGRTSSVSGSATSASGLPLGGETVTMCRRSAGRPCGWGHRWRSTKVAGDGAWTLSNVPPGEYRLSIRTAARGNQPAQEGQLTINVAGVDVEGLSLVAGAGGTVRGEVVTDDGSPLPAGFDRMQVRPPFNPNARMMTSILGPDNGRVRSDGSFEVQGVFSDTVLSIGPLPGEWTLKAIEVEGRDIADLPLPIEHGATLSGVRVVLTSRPTTIRGVAARREAESCGRDRHRLRGGQREMAGRLACDPGDTPRSARAVHVQGAASGRLPPGRARLRPGRPMARPGVPGRIEGARQARRHRRRGVEANGSRSQEIACG